MRTTEGFSDYDGAQTAYLVAAADGDELGAIGVRPLVVVHGGPGCTFDYLLSLTDLVRPGRPVVFYDQIGNGRSTHREGAPAEHWTVEFFLGELDALLANLGIENDYDLLGQSWGGMLAAEIAVRRNPALASVSICNSPASMPLWVSEAAKLRDALPDAARDALAEHEAAGTLDHPDYVDATRLFYERHVCRTVPTPQDFVDSEAQMLADPTVYHTMNGPNEFHVIGTLRDWSVIDRLPATSVPTLVVAGEYDEATPATWRPFADLIPGATAHVFPGASHCVHLEQPEEFRTVIADFLAQHP